MFGIKNIALLEPFKRKESSKLRPNSNPQFKRRDPVCPHTQGGRMGHSGTKWDICSNRKITMHSF